MNASMDTVSIEIQSVATDSVKAIDTLITSLDNLRVALKNVSTEAKGLKDIRNALQNATKIQSKVGTKAAPKTTKDTKVELPNVEKQLKNLNVDMSGSKMISSLTSMNKEMTKYRTTTGDTVTVIKKMKDGIESASVSVKKFGEAAPKDIWSNFNKSLQGVVSKIAAAGLVVKKLAGSVDNWVEESSSYVEAVNLFFTEMGNRSEEAYKWVNKFSTALYLDPKNIMQYMGSFNSLVEGLGVGSDNAYKMAKNLTQLTVDLASYKNLSYESAYDKLMSGVGGQIKGLKMVGVALSQNTLQELANELGIKQRVTTMNEAQKAELRYIQIMRTSTNWQADLGKTLTSTENIRKAATQQYVLLRRELGNIAAVIMQYLLPYFIAFTQILREAAVRLANFFGYKIDFDKYQKAETTLGKINTGVKDIGTSAGKTKNQLNTMLAPFDELNVVQEHMKSAGSGSGDAGLGSSGLGLDLPEYDALAKLTGELDTKVADAKKKLESLIPVIKVIIGLFAGMWAIKKIASFIGALKTLQNAFFGTKASVGLLKGVIGKTGLSFGKLGLIVTAVATSIYLGVKSSKSFTKVLTKMKDENKSLKKSFQELNGLEKAGFIYSWINPFGKILNLVKLTKTGLDELKSKASDTTDVVSSLNGSLSETTKTNVTPLINDFESLEQTMANLKFSGNIITDEDVNNINTKVDSIANNIVNQLDANKNEQLGNLEPLAKALGDEQYQKLLEKTTNYYDSRKKSVQDGETQIKDIISKANKENRKLTSEERDKINKIRNEMMETGVKNATEKSDEYYAIMRKLKDNTVAINTEQASKILQSAAKTRDGVIKNAKEQYENTLNEAYKMKETHAITDEEYEKIKKAAAETRDATIKDAKGQYDEIYKTTTEKLGETSKYIDKNTGEVKTKWDYFKDNLVTTTSEAFTNIKKTMTEKFNSAKTSLVTMIGTKQEWKKKFKGMVDGAGEKLEELKTKFSKWTAKIKVPHFKWNEDKGWKATGTVKKILEALHLPTKVPKLDISWYKNGGYPTKADLFYANENGIPEMVGRIGNRTAVANNDQITTAITNAIMTAFSNANFGTDKGTVVVNIGNKKVYEGMGEYINSESERYGTTYITI